MFRNLLQNCRKPKGFFGKIMVGIMNSGHANISAWGLGHLNVKPNSRALDIGCGGGANVKTLLSLCPQGYVCGVDYSKESVAVSCKKNAAHLGKRCDIKEGSVSALPYENDAFDIIIAFETVYFWPNIEQDFAEVLRVLKPNGQFLICSELNDPTDTTWPDKVEGMRIYSRSELVRALENSGFAVEMTDIHQRGWLCIVARKAG